MESTLLSNEVNKKMKAGIGKIFIIDDDKLIVKTLSMALEREGHEIESAYDAFNLIERIMSWSPDAILLDISLPDSNGIDLLRAFRNKGIDCEVVMITGDDSLKTAVKAMKAGACDYITKPFDIGEVRLVVKKVIEKSRLDREVHHLRKLTEKCSITNIVGTSPNILDLKDKVSKLARAEVKNVLITGESGSGKEVLARYFHHLLSKKSSPEYSPFIGINCTTLTETLIESELFGYEKGAFTDAKSNKRGLFEEAKGGVLLLDEIGDMKKDLQSKLLRVLEERSVRRIGGKNSILVDVTVIATTNQVLENRVNSGEFRKDLYFRLNNFALRIPPLRERKEDILPLAEYFLHNFADKYKNRTVKGFSRKVKNLLSDYSWPGNIRELRNVIERIVVLEKTETVGHEHLPPEIQHHSSDFFAATHADSWFPLPEGGLSLEETQKNFIVQALEKARNKKGKAAKLLGISYDALRYQMKKFELE